jgi:hypothetical protein
MKKLLIVLAALAAMSFGSKAQASIVVVSSGSTAGIQMVAKPSAGYLYLKGCVYSSVSGNCVIIEDSSTKKLQLCATSSTTVWGGGLAANSQGASQTGDVTSALGESIVFTGPVIAVSNATQTGDSLTCSFGTRLQ